jgi:hypothetical protein
MSESETKLRSSLSSVISDQSSSIESNASGASSIVSSKASSISDTASSSIRKFADADSASTAKVWGGADAAYVEGKQIILEGEIDEDTWAEQISSMYDSAGEKAAELSRAISEALLKPTSTQGSVESMTSLASEQYAKALSAASSALYGTPQPFTESLSSAASDKYSQAVTAYVFKALQRRALS